MNKLLMLLATVLMVCSALALIYILLNPDPVFITNDCGSFPPGPDGIASGATVCRPQSITNLPMIAIAVIGLSSGIALATYGLATRKKKRK